MPILNTRRRSVSVRATLALCLFPVIAYAAGAATPTEPAGQAARAAGTHHFTIPPQPLYSALDALAEQAALQLVYSAELVQALDSPGLSGDYYTPEDALTRLLAGTGLEYRYTGPTTVTLDRSNPPDTFLAQATEPRQDAGAPEPATKEADEKPTILPTLTVTGQPWEETSYTAPNATTATKTDTPIMETPYSIKVVPQQVLQDQQVFGLDKALQNVSGVVAFPANPGASGSVYHPGVL
ncbi:MAG: TonB-dependent receptor, partial [Acidobacteria bacterium]|nr:TonB-dependent receptor [Acidobacteriota bacterium]